MKPSVKPSSWQALITPKRVSTSCPVRGDVGSSRRRPCSGAPRAGALHQLLLKRCSALAQNCWVNVEPHSAQVLRTSRRMDDQSSEKGNRLSAKDALKDSP